MARLPVKALDALARDIPIRVVGEQDCFLHKAAEVHRRIADAVDFALRQDRRFGVTTFAPQEGDEYYHFAVDGQSREVPMRRLTEEQRTELRETNLHDVVAKHGAALLCLQHRAGWLGELGPQRERLVREA